MPATIPFHKPFLAGRELLYLAEALTRGQLAGDGFFTQRCQRLLEKKLGIARVFLTSSGTAALELSALLCGIQPGDEVLLPSFTFPSTASAFVRLGARLRFVDIRPDTLNLDERLLARALTPRTRVIVPVHYAGVACAMDTILEVAEKYELYVVEDAAQAVHAYFHGRALGSIGHVGAYSFHDTKNVGCGQGGALCLNRPELIERAEILRDKGTNRAQFLRGQVVRYAWVEVGSAYVPSELTAAFLYAQLERLEAIGRRRQRLAAFYQQHLEALQAEELVQLPRIPPGCVPNDHLFYLVLPSAQTRKGLQAHLRRHGIEAVTHYVPLHTSPMGRSLGYAPGDLPVTEDLSGRLLRLPLYPDLSSSDQARVVRAITGFLQRRWVRHARCRRVVVP